MVGTVRGVVVDDPRDGDYPRMAGYRPKNDR